MFGICKVSEAIGRIMHHCTYVAPFDQDGSCYNVQLVFSRWKRHNFGIERRWVYIQDTFNKGDIDPDEDVMNYKAIGTEFA